MNILSIQRYPTDANAHVGFLFMAAWLPFVAGAYGLEKFGEMHFGEDTRGYMKHIDYAVYALWEDIIRDICEYGSLKVSDSGVILGSETDGYPGWVKSVCEKRGFPIRPLPGQKPHVKSDWLTAFNYWMQDWGSYVDENQIDLVGHRPDRAQLDTWYTQLEGIGGWRDQFVKSGGRTITPAALAPDKPKPIPWTTIIIVGGIIGAALLLAQVRSFLPARILPVSAT